MSVTATSYTHIISYHTKVARSTLKLKLKSDLLLIFPVPTGSRSPFSPPPTRSRTQATKSNHLTCYNVLNFKLKLKLLEAMSLLCVDARPILPATATYADILQYPFVRRQQRQVRGRTRVKTNLPTWQMHPPSDPGHKYPIILHRNAERCALLR
ncbi:hypothetical protein GYMLUDRAFT_738032 [Collybiopsis luxurians FD-317 M1]|uniref:Uncharacterized protein n=1 Tax=Collybiopsis luxurians FD-317 M1 TaxID=944289 RepID=A0A0D0CQZ9_9AGAR|nr:hypothetical protein GYMLUDRAFT_738032 [Collybiopsis luxurians FD-317 M1]